MKLRLLLIWIILYLEPWSLPSLVPAKLETIIFIRSLWINKDVRVFSHRVFQKNCAFILSTATNPLPFYC